jgi:hypothetical protein
MPDIELDNLSIELIELIYSKFTDIDIYLVNGDKSLLTRSFSTRGNKKIKPERIILRAHRYAGLLGEIMQLESYNIRQVDKRKKKKA